MIGGNIRTLYYEGCDLHYRRFPRTDKPSIFLIHGGGAHLGWWKGVLPYLTGRFDITVPDLSGNGDSGRRLTYSPELWADEIVAIAETEGISAFTYVGHSMGGRLGVYLSTRYPRKIERLVAIDSVFRWPSNSPPRGRGPLPKKVYRSLQEAMDRWRLYPEENTIEPSLFHEVGLYALRETDAGWAWKFDPNTGQLFTDQGLYDRVADVECPVGFIYGSLSSIAGRDTVELIEHRIGRTVPSIAVDNAYHHVPLDEPEACANAIISLVSLLEVAPKK